MLTTSLVRGTCTTVGDHGVAQGYAREMYSRYFRRTPRPPRSGRPNRSRGAIRAMRTVRAGGAPLAATTLLVSACSTGKLTRTATTAADAVLAALPRATPSTLSSYYDQKLTWRNCGASGFECATMKAPLDYAASATSETGRGPQEGHRPRQAHRLAAGLNPGGPAARRAG